MVIQARINNLEQSIGQALEGFPESIGEGPEINPFQMLIAQIIQEKMRTPAIQVTEVSPRDKSGKFTR